jgi:hypothetical protein
MITDKKAIRKAAEVSEFLMELSIEVDDSSLGIPYDDFAYGEALLRWEADGFNPLSFFSTDDPFILHFREELEKEFKLEVLTHEEAEERKKTLSASVFTWRTTGFPTESDKLN